MSNRVVNLLHVEDEPVQQLLVRQILSRVPGFRFEVVNAVGEEEAVTAFHPGIEAVVLDYHLSSGNGLSCLRRLRQASPRVPILALSGAKSPTVAAELLAAGADDFFAKDGLDPDGFGAAIGQALARTAAWNRAKEVPDRSKQELLHLSRIFVSALGDDFFQRLNEFERVARSAGLTPTDIEKAAKELAASPDTAAKMRPLMLELAVRLLD
jgi:DNA-binding NarL/FixJ family response regulator